MVARLNDLSPHSITWYLFNNTRISEKKDILGTVYDNYLMDVKFMPDWYKYLTLEWTVPEEWRSYNPKFMVYQSESESGPFRIISGEPFSENRFVAYDTDVTAKFRNEFWVVQAVLDNGDIYKTPPMSVHTRLPKFQYLRFMDIIRRERILLDKFTGVESVIFRRREYGQRCSHCWNAHDEKMTDDNCPVCYGTSYEGGYYDGIYTKIQYDSSTDRRQYTYFGRFEPNQIAAWTVGYPTMSIRDIVIRLSDFHIFRVEALQNTEMLTMPLRQIMQLTELPVINVEYGLLKDKVKEAMKKRDAHVHHIDDVK